MEKGSITSRKESRLVDRRTVLKLLGVAGAASVGAAPAVATDSDSSPEFNPVEATASEIRSRYVAGDETAQSVVEHYLERIEEYEDELEAIITINSHVLDRAEELDEKLEADGPVGPLHGIPVVLKDNNDTGDIRTTAGSVALMDSIPPDDATIVTKIREAGGVILAKANLHEYAFGYDTISSLGGVTHNPYDLDRYAGGSSGGTGAGIAASFGVLGTGTDTGGSVRVPAAATNLVGLRPTTGLISRDGIVPLALSEDTAGPMTRTVADAALFTDVMIGYDPADPETSESVGRTPHAEGKLYTDYLDEAGLDGTRIGVYREYVGPAEDEESERSAQEARQVEDVFDTALSDIESAGATIVDPVETPPDELVNVANVDSGDEFNRDINAYLSRLGDDAPDTLAEIAASDEYAPANCETLREREEVDEDSVNEDPDYLYGLSQRDDLRQMVLATMAENELDAIVYPTLSQVPPRIDSDDSWGSNAQLTPALEFPSLTVPGGFTADQSLPVGIEFMARRFEEAQLFELTYSYEQTSRHRKAPDGFDHVDDSDTDWGSETIEEWNEEQRLNRTVEQTGECE
jgi:Asp-tRNA(Asn)/Glu-tRNA(Gln) amidotransferase A subunit family amidase